MDYATALKVVRMLTKDEQIELVMEIWEGLGDYIEQQPLDEETKRMLDERWAEHEANPEDVIPADQVFAEIRAKLKQSRS